METLIAVNNLVELTAQNAALIALFRPIDSEERYEQVAAIAGEIFDIVDDNPEHDLYPVLEVFLRLIEDYDAEHYDIGTATAIEVLQDLMERHGLKQTDMVEIGSQGVVSEVLNGKRTLNIAQVKALSERFHVAPGVFID